MTGNMGFAKSEFRYGDKRLDELSHEELLKVVEGFWKIKNDEIEKPKIERDGLRDLLRSPLPIHSLWRGFADNATLLVWIAFLAFLAGKHA